MPATSPHRRPAHRPALPADAARLLGALLATLTVLIALIACTTTSSSSAATSRHTPATARPAPLTTPVPAQPAAPAHATASSTGHPTKVLLRGGDTLWALAQHWHTTVATLQTLNHLGHSTLIYAGHHLLLPPTRTPVTTMPSAPARSQASTSTPTTRDRAGLAAVGFAQRQLGVPYQFGGTGKHGYDCSGLVQAAWAAAGVDLPRPTYIQATTGLSVDRSHLRPGDLVFTDHLGHVQLYAGSGHVIEAAHTGTTVRYAPLPPPDAVDTYRHPGTASAPHSAITIAPIHTPTHPTGPPQQLAAAIFGTQYGCAAQIIARESSWDPTAANASSGAYGLGQALPGAKMAPFGADWRTNPATQLHWMRAYIDARYGNACNAWAFWQAHTWY
ncbi:NlpC/P60 family protein [Streptomyces sp. NPDC004533]|uniref:aggregation-promoting factor C-terminal-like domain-containing protein n=1 Tax=Streptomyces sp. NPDC004533 TaxID=3154278 RepID=UPI0033A61682